MTNFAWCTSTSIRSLSAIIAVKFHVTYKLITLRLYLHQYKYFFIIHLMSVITLLFTEHLMQFHSKTKHQIS